MDVLIKISQFIACISLLVIVHEFGHYLFSRLFKIRVEKFYLFFNPKFSLVRMKRINGKWQFSWLSEAPPAEWKNHPEKTEWGIGWLPLGGYCKIAGMIDESMDTDQMRREPEKWEFRTHPAWQRLLVMVGGVMFNVILAMGIYVGITYKWGDVYVANRDVTHGVSVGYLGEAMGIENGDKIIRVGEEEVESFNAIVISIVRNQAESITVDRNGSLLELPVKVNDRIRLRKTSPENFISPRIPFIAADFTESSPASEAGVKLLDEIVAVNGIPVTFFDEAKQLISECKGEPITVSVSREGGSLDIPLTVSDEGFIGIYPQNTIPYTHISYGFFESIPQGVKKGVNEIGNYLKDLQLIFSPKEKAATDVGGFITIVKVFPGQWSWYSFWTLCALLSIMLAVVNMLPIPALDGGHVLFLLYEIVARRKPSEKFMVNMQLIGFLLLFALIIFANGNDIVRLFSKS